MNVYLLFLNMGDSTEPLLLGVANLEHEALKLKELAKARFQWMDSLDFIIETVELNKLLD